MAQRCPHPLVLTWPLHGTRLVRDGGDAQLPHVFVDPHGPGAGAGTTFSLVGQISHRKRLAGEDPTNLQDARVVGNDNAGMSTTMTPRLVVPDPDAAIAFYQAALQADLVARFELGDGSVTHAELAVDGASFALTAEVAAWGLLSPKSVGGSPTLLTLTVPDAPPLGEQMVEHGAVVIVPIEDRPYGRCEGRVQDPFGHLWILSHVTELLSDDETRNRMSGITAPRLSQPMPALPPYVGSSPTCR